MDKTYAPNLDKVPLERYRDILKTQRLLPSRTLLGEQTDARFAAMANAGIRTLGELKKILSSTKKRAAFAETSGVPDEYLNLLRREIGSLEPKAVNLSEFPEVAESDIAALTAAGIHTSRELFTRYTAHNDPEEFARALGIDAAAAHELFCLCDMVRVNGAGPLWVRLLYEAGFESLRDIALADAADMLARTDAVNRQKQYYTLTLGIKDMRFCIDAANILLRLNEEG